MGCRAGWVAGQVGWRAWSGGGPGQGGAGSGGGPGDWRGMDLQSKECSGVNIVT